MKGMETMVCYSVLRWILIIGIKWLEERKRVKICEVEYVVL